MRSVIAAAFGWEYVRTRDVGDMAPAHHDDYRTPDGRIINTEPPYWQNAVATEIRALLDRLKAAEAVVDVATHHHPTNCPASQHSSGRQRWHYCSDDQCKNPTHDRLVDCYRADWHDMDDALAAHSAAVVARGVEP